MTSLPPTWTTLTGALDVLQSVDRTLTYLDGEHERRTLRFADLRRSALGVLRFFQEKGVAAGDELILFTTSNEQFLDGFWACLYGGMVPVPVAVGISDDHRRKLLRIFATLRRPWVYTDNAHLSRLGDFARAHGLEREYEALCARALKVESIADVSRPGRIRPAQPDDAAFIQFSSGSTSEPKGIVLTHRNLLTNIRGIVSAARFTDRDVALSWMPLTHDMGLIGFHLCMLVAGISHTIMDTRLFSRRPLLWLREASATRATILSSPNFGYKHCLKVLAARETEAFDLSAVRLIFNGAEPISVPLCERFLDAMASHGLARTAMYPVYGLAEASLAVTFPPPGAPYRTVHVDRGRLAAGDVVRLLPPGHGDAMPLMVLGRAIPGCEVRIADDGDAPVPEGTVGHVQVRGGNVTAGYYGAVERPFTADGWLRTGDLGFLDAGELVVTGRHKEVIFVNGVNCYPQDIESIAEEIGAQETGRIAAVGARRAGGDEDELVLFAVHRGETGEFAARAERLRRHVGEQTGLSVAHVVPIRQLPRTTSGKLQRLKLAAAYAAGEFDAVIAELAATACPVSTASTHGTSTEQTLREICTSVITDRAVGTTDNLFDLGISSLALAQIHERIEETWPGRLDIQDLFELPSIAAIAAHLDRGAPADALVQTQDAAQVPEPAMQARRVAGRIGG